MAPRTATSHRGFVPWQGLLLTVSLLTFWSPLHNAQMTIKSVPFDAVEGADVLLLVHNLPENIIGYRWYKREKVDSNSHIAAYLVSTNVTRPGPAYSHRETIYPNGSLLIQKVTQQDTGFYTLQAIKSTLQNEEASGQFHVHQLVSPPSISASNMTVAENGSVVLTCLSDDTGISFKWIFENRSLQPSERMNLSQDGSILTIDPVKREDVGEYQCEASNPVSSSRSDPLRLAMICPDFCNSFTSQVNLPDSKETVPIYEELLISDMNVYCEINHRGDTAS
ncbi:carcinoembryonic antigen-related cell adhesion molecule 21-like isoform X2 [Cavia porcellus]|uniref:carcinoembryonic antigen-related cell adhesion molecule 21-like isoform X2 n=1 Tax=Cavia porcellus TaxID=10141 RepID=UPI000C87D801|nr:carcinoembryonic antigen-related cell adhesion molecule 21-like isoform X4 [Cavia porcellus]